MKRERPLAITLSLFFVSIGLLSAESFESFPEPVLDDSAVASSVLADLWSIDPAPADHAALSSMWASGPSPVLDMDFQSAVTLAQAAPSATDATSADVQPSEDAALKGLLNNEFFRESLRLKKLAEESFDYGDYDASSQYAADAAAAAIRSDEYVALRLKIRAVDAAIAKAKERIDWASSVGAERAFAKNFAAAKDAYQGAVTARGSEDYDLALTLAQQAVSELASVREIPPLPAKYKVRPWAETKDCFWNIAAYPWVYGDPTKWKVLYSANKAKLPRPEDPNLLRVGTVISIPSLKGEVRQGAWEKGKTYSSFSGR